MTLHWAENRRRYFLSMLAILGVMIIWTGVMLSSNGMNQGAFNSEQGVAYLIGICAIGALYSSTFFADLSDKKKAVQYLGLPASQFEKLLCGIFFGGVLYFIVATCIFYLVEIPASYVSLKKANIFYGMDHVKRHVEVVNVLKTDSGFVIPTVLPILFSIQAYFMLGSIYFKRYAFLKTTVSVVLLLVVILCILINIMEPALPEGWHWTGMFTWYHSNLPKPETYVESSPWLRWTVTVLLTFALPIVFWGIGYVRLQEKEV